MELQSTLTIPYELFFERVGEQLNDSANQITRYYGVREGDGLRMICTLKNNHTGSKQTMSYTLLDEPGILLASLSSSHPQIYVFESDISNSLGIHFACIGSLQEQQS